MQGGDVKKKFPCIRDFSLQIDSFFFFFFCLIIFNIYLFIWLHRVLVVAGGLQLRQVGSSVVACGLLSCGMRTLGCCMHVGSSSLSRDRTHQGSPAGNCATREVPQMDS